MRVFERDPDGSRTVDDGRKGSEEEEYYRVLYAKRSNKKRKTYQDGVLVVKERNRCLLMDESGKELGKDTCKDARGMPTGATLRLAAWELLVDAIVPPSEYMTGTVFLSDAKDSKSFRSAKMEVPCNGTRGGRREPSNPVKLVVAEDAIVLNEREWKEGSQSPVLLPRRLKEILRPHQVDGVRFMYQCTSGNMHPTIRGCILADDMGLGKTLQALSLVYALMNAGPRSRPLARRSIIVCPSSLCNNWANECRKWFGDERMRALVVRTGERPREAVEEFCMGCNWPLLIISYELIRKFAPTLARKCDLLVCDEGHRLKQAQGNQTIHALRAVQCPRRVILTGTPFQNSMDEFYALVDFVNPGFLGELGLFRSVYAGPIAASKERGATESEKVIGAQRFAELKRRTECFLLRRSSKINERYLPSKKESVLFCPMSSMQRALYQALLRQATGQKFLTNRNDAGRGATAQALSFIFMLRQLCNHPDLIFKPDCSHLDWDGVPFDQEGGLFHELKSSIQSAFPSEYNLPGPLEASGKLKALLSMLEDLFQNTSDRTVVVSSSVRCLDLIGIHCANRGWSMLRLDGRTDVKERQNLVDRFNHGEAEIFLLSTTAGGTGLNLVGANRLFLFDSSWNPASDLQAMARVWRDGQRKEVYIYRLLTAGTIEEKIFQRQVSKGEMAALVNDARNAEDGSFTTRELKELFVLHETKCHTFDIMRAEGCASGNWSDATKEPGDDLLARALRLEHLSFVLQGHPDETETSSANASNQKDRNQETRNQADEGETRNGPT